MSNLNGHVIENGWRQPQLQREMYGGEIYEYYPLGQHIVCAPGVCGGRPTFKYTRLEVSMILSLLSNGDTIDELLKDYSQSIISAEAIQEALRVARDALLDSTRHLHLKKVPNFELEPA